MKYFIYVKEQNCPNAVIQVVNIILQSENIPLADMNEDGIVNILDVIILVNIILDN